MPAYTVIVNAPGYLPDEEPQVFPSWNDAVLGLHKALVDTREALFSDEDVDADIRLEQAALSVDEYIREMAKAGKVAVDISVQYAGLAHSIHKYQR